MIESDRELELVIHWRTNAKADLARVENLQFKSINLDSSEDELGALKIDE